ncbi:MAG: hypothetical protein H0S80_06200 [Desulfovibrionaceae bacterium]|nr:hypothetical protein [Desulfovibrionaceae bacterium]
MLDIDTFSLILILSGLILLGAVGFHYANCSNMVRRKRREFESLSYALEQKIFDLEQEVVDLQMQIDKVDEQINSMEE